MIRRSSFIGSDSAEASSYLLEAGPVTEMRWTSLYPSGNLKDDLLRFHELEYKRSQISMVADTPALGVARGVLSMSPRRRDAIVLRMDRNAVALAEYIAGEMLPTFESWVQAHDLDNLDVMGAARMKKLVNKFAAKNKTGDLYDWVLRRSTVGRSMEVVTSDEWSRALGSDKASTLRFALELLHEDEYAGKGSFDEFVKRVVARDPVDTVRRAVKQLGVDDKKEAVLQMFQTVYPIGYTKRLGASSREVGRDITKAQDMLLSLYIGSVDSPKVFTDLNWILNVVHQSGKMADHVARDMGISLRYLTKLSNLDTSEWDAELQAMATPTESVTEVCESVGYGEWWIDEMGTAQFADGDVGDMNHAGMAMMTMLAEVDFDVDDPEAPEIFPMEPLSDEAVAYLKELDVDPKVLEFLSVGDDPREWMIEHRGWIRLMDNNAEVWEWNDATLDTLRGGVFDAWGLDGEQIDGDDFVMVEEAETRQLFSVPLQALMNERYDAQALRQRASGEPDVDYVALRRDAFVRAAWARKAAGERGVDEAVGDDHIDWDSYFSTETGGATDPNGDDDVNWKMVDAYLKKYPPKVRKRRAPGLHVNWEIPGELGRTSRPGYPSRKMIPLATVDEWIMRAKKKGIKSIILLLGPDQLHMYNNVPGGLPKYYHKNGFNVAHVPMFDLHKFRSKKNLKMADTMQHVSPKDLKRAYAAFKKLPKPVLVHCSAGVDRSGAVVEYIADQEFGPLESVGLLTESARASSYLLEGLGSYVYKIPDDKEELLYDFYMMTFLPGPDMVRDVHGYGLFKTPGEANALEKEEQERIAAGELPILGPRYRRADPNLADSLEETRDKLVYHLKPELLNAVFYSIACEARYIFEKVGPPEKIFSLVKEKFGKKMAAQVRRYWTEYSHFKKHSVEKGRSPEVRGVHQEFMASQESRNASYRAALSAFKGNIQDFIRFTEWGFFKRPWGGYDEEDFMKALKNYDKPAMAAASGSYGGGNWGRISRGWLALNDSSGTVNDMMRIDGLYSLQHNTGAVLNKVKSYMKNGTYDWLKRALDLKFNADSPYEFAHKITPSMRRLAMAAIYNDKDTTLDQWVKNNPLGKKAIDKGETGDGTKKDYVYTKNYKTKVSMKKSLLKWYSQVTKDNVDYIVDAAIAEHGLEAMKNWQFPAYAGSITKTSKMSSPLLLQGPMAQLVQVKNGVLSTTEKHKYFDKKKPGVEWMSAKHLGITPELTHFRKKTAEPEPAPKPKKKITPDVSMSVKKSKGVKPEGIKTPSSDVVSKMGFPQPSDTVDVSTINPAINKIISQPIGAVYVEMFQPAKFDNPKIKAIKGIRQTYGMGLKEAKMVVDHAETNDFKPAGMSAGSNYTLFWWPTGDYVTLGSDITKHPQANWGKASIAFASNELSGKEGVWAFQQASSVKMIDVHGRWYVKADEIVNSKLVEKHASKAPEIGTQMVKVRKLGDDKKNMAVLLLGNAFGIPEGDAADAVDKLATIHDLNWIDMAAGKIAFQPSEFTKIGDAKVAMWNSEGQIVIPVPMASWGYGDDDTIYVMSNNVKAASTVVLKDSFKPIDVHEGSVMYVVFDPVFGMKLFGPTSTANTAAENAKHKKTSNPNVVIDEYIFVDNKWQLMRRYNTDFVIINTNEDVLDLVKKHGGYTGVEKKPKDAGVYFKLVVVSPTGMHTYAFNNKVSNWAKVEKGVELLKDPKAKIDGVPYDNDHIVIEKWANKNLWPEGTNVGSTEVDGDYVLVETMNPSLSYPQGKYNSSQVFVNSHWDDLVKSETGPVGVLSLGPFPVDRQQVDDAIASAAKVEPKEVRTGSIKDPVVTFIVKVNTPNGFVHAFVGPLTQWAQVVKAVAILKDPESGFDDGPYGNDDIKIDKIAQPIAWPPQVDVSSYKNLDTSVPTKVEELDTDGVTTWIDTAWNQVVGEMKAAGQPWLRGNTPWLRGAAISWSKVAKKLQAEKTDAGKADVVKDEHTGLGPDVLHDFMFMDSDGNETVLEFDDFDEALEEANELESELSDDMFATMHLDVANDVYKEVTGKDVGGDMSVVTYGLPEGYIKYVDPAWGDATGLSSDSSRVDTSAEKRISGTDKDMNEVLVSDVLETWPLSDEASNDLSSTVYSGDEMLTDVWDIIDDHTKTELRNIWNRAKKRDEPQLKKKPWNAWIVQEVVQIPLSDEAKAELKTFGGGQIMAEIWGDLSGKMKNEILHAIIKWQHAVDDEDDLKPAEPKTTQQKIVEPGFGVSVLELTFGQVDQFLDLSDEAGQELKNLKTGHVLTDHDALDDVWIQLSTEVKNDISSAYHEFKINKSKVPQEEPEKKPSDFSDELWDMAPAEVAAKLSVNAKTATELTYGNPSKFNNIRDAWSFVSDAGQKNIIDAWEKKSGKVIKKKKKKVAKKKVAKKKVAKKKGITVPQATKNVKTWKLGSVLKFLYLPDTVKNYLTNAIESEDSVWFNTDTVGSMWIAMGTKYQDTIVQAYIEFMKNKHGLEGVSESAGRYLIEAKKKKKTTYPRITRKAYGGAEGSYEGARLDLYFVRYGEGEKEYCFALDRSLLNMIEKMALKYPGKAASIVKARSKGEYDCETGKLKHLKSKPRRSRKKKKTPERKKQDTAGGQMLLFDESAQASMYLLNRSAVVEAELQPGMTYTPVEFSTKHAWVSEQMIRDVMSKHRIVVVEIDDVPREPSKNVPKELRQLVRDFRKHKGGKEDDGLSWHVRALVPNEPEDLLWDIQDVIQEAFGLTYWAVMPRNRGEWVPKDATSGGYVTEAKEPTDKEAEIARSKETWRPEVERTKHTFPHGFIIDGEFHDIGGDVHVRWAAGELGIEGSGPDGLLQMGDDEKPVRDEMARQGWIRLTSDDTILGEGGVQFYGQPTKQAMAELQNVLLDNRVKVRGVWVEAPGFFGIKVELDDLLTANSFHKLQRLKIEMTEDVDRDEEANKMLSRYGEEPTSIWLYTDMPVKDRVAWAYLAADRYMSTDGEDLVSRFMNTLRLVVDDPETFWEQIRAKDEVRANYLDHLDWDIEVVQLKDVGVYPGFSGFSDETCRGNVLETAAAIEATNELPEKVAKLRSMSDVWTTVLKFLPPILVPGGILRSERQGYEVLKWTIDDGNHRLVSAAMAGATEAVCFVGKQKKESSRYPTADLEGAADEAVRFARHKSIVEVAGTMGWYNPRTDDEIEGDDHRSIVRDNLSSFGLPEDSVVVNPSGFGVDHVDLVKAALEKGWVRVNFYGGDLLLQGVSEGSLRKAYWYYVTEFPVDYVVIDVGSDDEISQSRTIKAGPDLERWLQESQEVAV